MVEEKNEEDTAAPPPTLFCQKDPLKRLTDLKFPRRPPAKRQKIFDFEEKGVSNIRKDLRSRRYKNQKISICRNPSACPSK